MRRRWYRALEQVPAAYCAWHRRYPGRHAVDANTDLLVEGYPSAANTFTREAFTSANPGIRIASHLHTVAHVRRALDLGVPVLVLLRPPVDSVVSLLARFPARSSDIDTELRDYIRFYRGTLGLADQVALSCFEHTTTRLGEITRAVNRRFGSSFVPFDQGDPRAQSVVRDTIATWTEVVFGPDSERHQALPSDRRRTGTNVLRTGVISPAHALLRMQADGLYRDLAAIARARFDDVESTEVVTASDY